MNKRIIEVKGMAISKAPISQAVVAGNFVFTAGQIPIDPETGIPIKGTIKEKVIRTLENLKLVLEAANIQLADVIKINVFVSNLENVPIFNDVYKAYFPDKYPVRSCVEISRLAYGVEFEVEAVAYIDNKSVL